MPWSAAANGLAHPNEVSGVDTALFSRRLDSAESAKEFPVAIPDYQSLMLPLLETMADGKERGIRELYQSLATEFRLSETERKALLPSGRQPIFENRVGWAKTYLAKAELLEATRRGFVRITPVGASTLAERPQRIDVKFLERFPKFEEFRESRRAKEEVGEEQEVDRDASPEESLEGAYQRMRADLATDLLEQVMTCSPSFFEKLVVELLLAMGYGGSRKDADSAIGQKGDGGIDGIIKEDKLGLDAIYLQAKRWANPVGRPEIQGFVGALQEQHARKGVFITTSSFTREAKEYVTRIENKVVLIDGDKLANLMIDHGIGVAPIANYVIHRIDNDYFGEE